MGHQRRQPAQTADAIDILEIFGVVAMILEILGNRRRQRIGRRLVMYAQL